MERFKTTGVGKGSATRISDLKKYGKEHERIFGKKKLDKFKKKRHTLSRKLKNQKRKT